MLGYTSEDGGRGRVSFVRALSPGPLSDPSVSRHLPWTYEVAVDEEVGAFKEGALLGELLDRVASVSQDCER